MKNGTLSEESDKLSMTRWLLLDKMLELLENFRLEKKRLESETKIMPIYTQSFLSAFLLKDANRILTRTHHHVKSNQRKVL